MKRLLIIGALLVAVLSYSSPGGATSTVTINLHGPHVGATNADFQEGECPSGGYGWHFVTRGQTQFVSVTAVFANTGTVQATVGQPTNKHAYAYTAGIDTLLSATAVVTGGEEGDTFLLSHVCVPEVPETTTSTVPETTTTVPETTTTVPPTTTVPESTTTSTVESTTTTQPTVTSTAPSTSSMAPPEVIPPAEVARPVPIEELAFTGRSEKVAAIIGIVTLVIGCLLLIVRRRL